VRDVVGTGGSDFDLLVEMRSEGMCFLCVCQILMCAVRRTKARAAYLKKQGAFAIWHLHMYIM
jgi:hypothetical protein